MTIKKNITYQFGILAQTKLDKKEKLALYSSAAIGSSLTNLEVGLSYAFTPNIEFNVNYRDINARHIPTGDWSYNPAEHVRGIDFGLTVKFGPEPKTPK